MASEFRRLIFSQDEMITAALDFCRYDRIRLPDAAVERIELSANQETSLTLYFRTSDPMDRDQIILSEGQLINALARFCKRQEIPLPLCSEKQVSCEQGNIALQFDMKHRIPCETNAASA